MKTIKTTTLILLSYGLFVPIILGQNISVIFSSNQQYYKTVWAECKKGIAVPDIVTSEYVIGSSDNQSLIKEIETKNPEVLVAIGSEAALLSVTRSLKNIPVVYTMVLNADNLKDDNITGVSLRIPAALKIQALKKALPRTSKIGILYSDFSRKDYGDTVKTCDSLGVQVLGKQSLSSNTDFSTIAEDVVLRSDCFLMLPDPNIYFAQIVKFIIMLCAKHNIPIIGLSSQYTKFGALMSIESDYTDIAKQTAEIITAVLSGKPANEIKPAVPRKIKVSVNLATASKMKIEFDKTFLENAEVFNN